jgi:O-antigen/teichoic acid export membrane protein
MLHELRRLMKETAIYGLSTIVGRLLNVLLMPLYTHAMAPAEYGLVATIFSYIAFLTVVYAHGMDFAFMRHYKEPKGGDEDKVVFSTAFASLVVWPLLVSLAIVYFAAPLTLAAGVPLELKDVVKIAGCLMFTDAVALVPLAHLRMREKAWAFALVEFSGICLNLALNWLFLLRWSMGVRGVFLASLCSSVFALILLSPVIIDQFRPRFDGTLYKSLLRFALPIIPAGVASMMVQVIDRPILKALTNDSVVGVYQANYRLAVFMQMVINMFDTAWRPFFLQRANKPGAPEVFARVMSYFTAGSLFACLGLSLFAPMLVAFPLGHGRTLITEAYWGGLPLVPIVALGYVFNGMYVNLLAPVTLAKKTERVAYATAAGALVNVAANLLWIPRWGMMGAAAATLAAYAAMAGTLYLLSRDLYPIPYERGRLGLAAGAALLSLGAARAFGLTMHADRPLARLITLAVFPAFLLAAGFLDAGEKQALRAKLRL